MDTLVVTTEMFPTDPEGDLDLCNGQPGSAFAQWLKERLESDGLDCDSLIQEDYGWGFWINSKDTTIWVCVSYAGFSPDDETNKADEGEARAGEWFVSANHEIPFLLFRPWLWGKTKVGSQEEARIFALLKDAIEQEDRIQLLREE